MPNTDSCTDEALLERWQCGEVRAGAALLARHTPALTRFLRRRAGPDAEDLLQATLLACIESRSRFRAEASFRTYLFTIARHELHRLYRQRARRLRHDEPASTELADPLESPLMMLVRRQLHDTLGDALARLSAAERELLRQFYADERDSFELGSEHGVKPASVRARLHRARKRLEQEIRRMGWDDLGTCDTARAALALDAPRDRAVA